MENLKQVTAKKRGYPLPPPCSALSSLADTFYEDWKPQFGTTSYKNVQSYSYRKTLSRTMEEILQDEELQVKKLFDFFKNKILQ